MNVRTRKFAAALLLIGNTVALTANISFAQATPATTTTTSTTQKPKDKDETLVLEKFEVTGSFIPQPTAEPIAPVAIVSEIEMRTAGVVTPIEALRYVPSFVGNPGATEFDSNGGNGSTFVSLRGLGSGQTLTLLNGHNAGNFANLQLVPIEAVDRIEVLRDGAGIIYGSSAIGGAVNVILKKNYSGLTTDLYGGSSTRTPGDRATFQASFIAGSSTDKTSIVASGSYFKERTIYASQRPNSAVADQRPNGGVNGGSPTFATVISSGGSPLILKSGVSSPTALSDYDTMDTNTFSSNQLFNFRQYSPSAPGQRRNSSYVSIDHKIFGEQLAAFGYIMYAKLRTFNGLAPSPFALDAEPAEGGPAVGSVTTFGPYNRYTTPTSGSTPGVGGILKDESGDFFRYRSVELGNRTNEQVFNDFRYTFGLRGEITSDWRWEVSAAIENEHYIQTDAGVPDLKKLDTQIIAGNFNPFALAFSKGSATIGGKSYSWDNAAALQAANFTARITEDTNVHELAGRITGKVLDLPAGPLQLASGYEHRSSNDAYNPESAYASGSVLGLNSLTPDYNEAKRESIFAEVKVPLMNAGNNLAFVHDLSLGALARNESQTIYGTNRVLNAWGHKKFTKTNPSVNLQYSPTDEYKVRATWSKGYRAPSASTLFRSPGQSNPTIADPLGFPTTAQTTIVIRGNPNLTPETSKAWSLGLIGAPKRIVKGFNFSLDYYHIEVSGIVANNANAILAANAAGQGAGFVAGNAATINPNAPFAKQIARSANGRLNSSGSFAANFPGLTTRGAVLSDYLNIASRQVSGLEYTATYTNNTSDLGRFTSKVEANQFLKFDQTNAPGLPKVSYLGKFVSTVGDPISPGSIPRWKGNITEHWNYKGWDANVVFNYIAKYKDDPLFVLSPKMLAFYKAGTPKSDPTYSAFLSAVETADPKLGGTHYVSAFTTLDVQLAYRFTGGPAVLNGTKVSIGARNLLDKLAPLAFGAFNDSYDTRTHNNVGRFVYAELRREF